MRFRVLFILALYIVSIPMMYHPNVFALTPSDAYVSEQWYLDTIGAYSAWDIHTGTGDVVVAILDTGIDLDHPDLEENIWVNTEEIPGDGIDNDQNGFVDDVHGYDFIDGDGSPIPDADQPADEGAVSHGTVIAGIIGAVGDNEIGMAGVNWDVQLMSVRILDNQGIGDSNTARLGVEYAVANGADVINLSFTGFDFDDNLRLAIEEAYDAGVVVVAAMGNAENGGIDIDDQPIFPACFGERAETDWILGVAATDEDDVKASFSNYGAECTDISAPGEEIFSTVYQDDNWLLVSDGFYQTGWSGTSMASPMVAGSAALLKSAYPSLSPDEIKSILRLSVDPVIATGDAKGKMGAGRLNLAKAFDVAGSFVDEPNLETPMTSVDPSYGIAVAPESGSPPHIRVFSNSGDEVRATFSAYDDSFTGGVRLAMGDVDGDGEEEIVTVPGVGGSAHVRIFTMNGVLEKQFYAFDTNVRSGFFVATGDTDGDGIEEIAVSTDVGSQSMARIFDIEGNQQGETINPFSDIAGKKSLRIALGDVDGDDQDEVVFSLGAGYEPRVEIYRADGSFHQSFLSYAQTYNKGVFVASGDLDGDGDDEIVTGTDNGGGPQVQIFDGRGNWLGTFFAYDENFRGGVRLSVGNLSSWPGASIITAAGPGGGPHVRVYNGYANLIGTFFSQDEDQRSGINSAAWGL